MNLLEAYPLYKNFSNKAWIPDASSKYDSLESLHDQIHGLVGTNGGHMAYVSKALCPWGISIIYQFSNRERSMLANPSKSSNMRRMTRFSGYTMPT